MKACNLIKSITALILAIAILAMCVGCGTQSQADRASDLAYYEGDFSDVTSSEASEFIKFMVADDLEENMPDYSIDYVDCIYISQEYIDELYYNSLSNVYYGYDYAEIEAYMQGTNWCFTVDENGDTVVSEVPPQSNLITDLIKKVAIGVGVILVCVVVSYVTAGAGTAPVACFFAGAAKGALVGAVSGGAVSGAIGGIIGGVQTQSWEGALNGALAGAADGFMWGAISGAVLGGFSSTACFVGNTMVKTDKGYTQICDVSENDLIYSFNESTQAYEYQPVTSISKKTSNEIIKIHIGNDEIETTPTHPFYTPNGWIDAQNLTSDTELLTKNGFEKITFIEKISLNEEQWVYNMTIPFTHTYTVGLEEIVVHNACGDSAKLRQNLIDAGDVVPEYSNAAHHIVPSSANNPAAVAAREKLGSLGIGINDASNGVFLSTSKGVVGTTYHRTLHTSAYYTKVNSLLSTATTKEQGLAVLKYIKTALSNGTFMP